MEKLATWKAWLIQVNFMNQFETGTSGGTLSDKFRKEATKNLFGVKDTLESKNYEKYGYLVNGNFLKDFYKNEALDMYGDLVLIDVKKYVLVLLEKFLTSM